MWNGIYYGIITEAYSPDSQFNANKFQYEYNVLVTGDYMSQIPMSRVIKSNSFGSLDDHGDTVLHIGSKVLVACVNGNTVHGVIIAELRNIPQKIKTDDGVYKKTRFNKIEEYWDKSGHWSLKLDTGPNIQVQKDIIIIDNTTGEKITFDKVNKTLQIDANNLKIIVNGNANISVQQNAQIDVKKNINISGQNITMKAKKDITLQADGDINVKAAKTATVKGDNETKVDGPKITLGKGTGAVLTQVTMPLVDNVTGVPSMGVTSITAG